MLILSKSQVAHALPHAACIPLMRQAMLAVSAGDVDMPLRRYMQIPDTSGKMTLMPGYTGGDINSFGFKVVSKYPREPDSPFGTHVGAVMVFDKAQGTPIGFMHGGELTAIRTSSATALATDVLARKDATRLLIIGAGEEARHHIAALVNVRDFKTITVWARKTERAQACADAASEQVGRAVAVAGDLETAVGEADVICTVTSAKEPVLMGRWLKPGTHVNLVGAAIPTSAEADTDVVTAGRYVVDYLPSALDQAGELLGAMESGAFTEDQIAGEIGQILAGEKPGRADDQEITVYKSLGVAAQDLAAAVGAVAAAKEKGLGQSVAWED